MWVAHFPVAVVSLPDRKQERWEGGHAGKVDRRFYTAYEMSFDRFQLCLRPCREVGVPITTDTTFFSRVDFIPSYSTASFSFGFRRPLRGNIAPITSATPLKWRRAAVLPLRVRLWRRRCPTCATFSSTPGALSKYLAPPAFVRFRIPCYSCRSGFLVVRSATPLLCIIANRDISLTPSQLYLALTVGRFCSSGTHS